MNKGKLFLIPVTLGKSTNSSVLPDGVMECARLLTHFIAENAKSARAFLKSLPSSIPLQQLHICELNEHTGTEELSGFLTPKHSKPNSTKPLPFATSPTPECMHQIRTDKRSNTNYDKCNTDPRTHQNANLLS